jgi:hypothetical protein
MLAITPFSPYSAPPSHFSQMDIIDAEMLLSLPYPPDIFDQGDSHGRVITADRTTPATVKPSHFLSVFCVHRLL